MERGWALAVYQPRRPLVRDLHCGADVVHGEPGLLEHTGGGRLGGRPRAGIRLRLPGGVDRGSVLPHLGGQLDGHVRLEGIDGHVECQGDVLASR